MNWKVWMPLALAIVLGAAAAKIGRDVLLKNRGGQSASAKLVKVVAAAHDLDPGQALGESDLKGVTLPAEVVPQGAFTRPGDLLGRAIGAPVAGGQLIFESLLTPKELGGGAQALVPDGMRAVTLEVNEYSGVGGLLAPGCRVDVVSTLRDDKTGQQIARTLVQDVKVIAVGQKMGTSHDPSAKQEDPGALARSVTIIATPREAEAMELATSIGRTRLVLRNRLDRNLRPSEALSITELLSGKSGLAGALQTWPWTASSQAKPATQPGQRTAIAGVTTRPSDTTVHAVQIIKGTSESVVNFTLSHQATAGELTDNPSGPMFPSGSGQ